jgi:hypothetical protein
MPISKTPISRTLWAIAAAAFGAAVILALPGFSPPVEAGIGVSSPAVQSSRPDLRPTGPACSQHAWPYYEPQCLRDSRNADGRARPVRIVSTDKLAIQ